MQNENIQNNTKKENYLRPYGEIIGTAKHGCLYPDVSLITAASTFLYHLVQSLRTVPSLMQSGVVNQPSSLVVSIPCPKVDIYCFIVPTASFYCLQLPRTS
ncbi:hypothetical protein AMECASPLE_029879 [Ameca splendens]|uniref:Uncharacterized protein n=1 Tax=Ameca splendens TaxID=208324 RepID=A0ABV0Y639_9TELE